MGIIHMETDAVEGLVSHLRYNTDTMQDKVARLHKSRAILSLTWHSPRASQFRTDFSNLIKQLDFQIEFLQNLAQRLQQELDEWLQVCQYFGELPKKRVYLINGINYTGDEHLQSLKEDLKKQYGDDVDIVIVEAHPYTEGTDYANAIKSIPDQHGTQFGGWLMPVDLITGGGAAIMNWGRDRAADGVPIITGVTQVGWEYISGGGNETQDVYNWIEQDLKNHGLLNDDNLEVILVGHSGGGAIAANLSEKLEKQAHVDVTGVVTLGSPVANLDKASEYAEVFDVNDRDDGPAYMYGIGLFRSEEMRYAPLVLPFIPSLPPFIRDIISKNPTYYDQLFRNKSPNIHRVDVDGQSNDSLKSHSNYFNDKAVSKDVVKVIGEASGVSQGKM